MIKQLLISVLLAIMVLNVTGCVPLLAGAAGGLGTATWLSDKLTQDFNVTFKKALGAVKSGLRDLKMEITKETVKSDVAQIMSKYTDEKTVWIDIHRLSATNSRIEVRVGITGDQAAAAEILNSISKYL